MICFFKQKTAYEMRISDWSSDVCSSDLAAVASFVAGHGGNVIDLQQHTDDTDGAFFQRVEFELENFDLPADGIGEAFAPVAERFQMRWTLRFSADRPRVAIMASKEPHCLHDLLNRWRTGELDIEVPVVVSNHPDHAARSEEHTSELQSLMRISYAVFCFKKK